MNKGSTAPSIGFPHFEHKGSSLDGVEGGGLEGGGLEGGGAEGGGVEEGGM